MKNEHDLAAMLVDLANLYPAQKQSIVLGRSGQTFSQQRR
jgi:hypothetical protein